MTTQEMKEKILKYANTVDIDHVVEENHWDYYVTNITSFQEAYNLKDDEVEKFIEEHDLDDLKEAGIGCVVDEYSDDTFIPFVELAEYNYKVYKEVREQLI